MGIQMNAWSKMVHTYQPHELHQVQQPITVPVGRPHNLLQLQLLSDGPHDKLELSRGELSVAIRIESAKELFEFPRSSAKLMHPERQLYVASFFLCLRMRGGSYSDQAFVEEREGNHHL